MKYLNKNIYILFILVFTIISCNEDDFLTQQNPNANSVSLFYQNENDFNSALTTVYGALQFQSISGRNLVSEFAQGDLGGTTTFARLAIQFNTLTYNSADEAIVSKWNELYIGIHRANNVIQNIQAADASMFVNVNKNEIEGQARFLRAFFYFQLIHTYGGAVIHTEVIDNPNAIKKPFSSIDDVNTEVIIPDLEFAMENLPRNWTGNDIGRATWGAATSLLGKVYLYNETWDKSADLFDKVIKSQVYSLTPDISDNFTHTNEFNSESILETNYSFDLSPGVGGANVDDTPTGTGAESSALVGPIGKSGNGGFNQLLVSYYLHELMVADEVDSNNPINDGNVHSKRMNTSIAPSNYEGLYYLANFDDLPGPKFNAYGISAYPKKHSNWYHLDAEPAMSRSGINFRHIRYADVLLMYAEAVLNDTGDFTTAITYIDQVRSRAGVKTIQQYMTDNAGQFPQLHISEQVTGMARPLVSPSKETVLTHLRMVERPTELCYEGFRWKDLVRWGIVKEVLDEQRAEEIWRIANYGTIRSTAPLFLSVAPRNDYEQSSSRYNADYDYWPVPNSEVQTNDNL